MSKNETASLILKNLVFTVVVPGTATVLIPCTILGFPDFSSIAQLSALQWVGIVPLLIGVCIYVWCVFDFAFAGRGTPAPIDPPKELVVRGLYRFTRNPMYVGVLSVVVSEAVLFGSAAVLLYAACLLTVFHSFVVFYEEPTLRRLFGEGYDKYCATVPRWAGTPRR